MKGKTLVIGLVLFILIGIALIYITMTITMNNMENGMAPVVNIVELLTEVEKI